MGWRSGTRGSPMVEDKSAFKDLTVLIVDDDAFMCRLVGDLCQSIGFKKIIRTSVPTEVLEILKCNEIDVMVCDLLMQPMDGLNVVRLVRQAPDSPNTMLPIIMLTGCADAAHVTEARDAGVNAFIVKPVSLKVLLSRLTQVLKNPRPFTQTEAYVGPDRRNREEAFEGPDRRAQNAPQGVDEASTAEN